MAESLPPPIYSQQAAGPPTSDTSSTSDVTLDPQILITSSSDAMNFQKGYLGADEERAAIEGEIHVKGAQSGRWTRVTVSLRTLETACDREIELGFSDIELFSSFDAAPLPSSFLFAIPLMDDTPQSLRTPHSSISHTLTATLHPLDASLPAVSKSIVVHTKRYTAHSHSLPVSPETHSIDEPTRVEVQIPRTTFIAGEAVPLYVTVPPPPRELVVDQGLRLRNVRVELLRIVQVNHDECKLGREECSSESCLSSGPSSTPGITPPPDKPQSSSSKASVSPSFRGSLYEAVVARSGASSRFHSSRPVRLRFILHQPSPSESPSDFHANLPTREYGYLDNDAECASITQLTLLHSVTFRINIHVSFVDMSSHTERISTISIPVIMLAPPAPLPEIAPSVDVAYSKKHDRPPARTVRYEDADSSAPHYSEGEAGPSALPGGAPPPFEERDAPPPFFSSAAEASSSSRLPTFLESETEIIIPPDDTHSVLPPRGSLIIGEGVEFGFSAADQFDGHLEDMPGSSTPPPTLEMASRDADLSSLASIHEPERAIDVLGLVLDQHETSSAGTGAGGDLPPPPPALDDPSDPPPSIDSEFRSPDTPPLHPPSPPSLAAYAAQPEPARLNPPSPTPPLNQSQTSDGHAPPPYLVPDDHPHQQEHAAGPPPYMD
ncbi:hypothetical protein GGX14DRAFT_531419 [Mycena pura]|uniref:Uncharacterized protein n=1 Tax=Mycena pura TaxID=153505 RepID=A0AAD6YQA1_9AGAR|nr:hypothetical protein GGX14DRAFT_531419 [Mycena pura]